MSLKLSLSYFVIQGNKCTKTQVKLRLNDDEIEQVCSVKFLGVYIDERLTWDNHIQQVASKLSKNIGILAKLKYTVPQKVLCLIYNSLVLPYLTYCNLVWACNSANKLNSVVVLLCEILRKLIIVLILVLCLRS